MVPRRIIRCFLLVTLTAVVVESFTGVAPVVRRQASRSIASSPLSSSVSVVVPAAVNGAKVEEVSSSSSPNLNIRLNVNEKARTVTSVCTSGTLCTVSAHEGIEGAPFGSFVDYVLDDQGNPVLLMNDMSMHTMNIQKAAATKGGGSLVTLFCQISSSSSPRFSSSSSSSASASPSSNKYAQDVSRCSLTGVLKKIPPSASDMDTIRMRYSLTHAYADQVMDSPKFSFYRLIPSKIYFVGGFGVMAKWVEPEDYHVAAPDILAKEAPDIVARINRDHTDDLRLTAQHLLQVETQIEKVRLTNVDRLGMDVRVTSQMGTRRNKLQTDEFRIGFRIPVISVEDAKSEILKVFQEAWEKGNGFSWDDEEEPGSNVPIMKIAADSLE